MQKFKTVLVAVLSMFILFIHNSRSEDIPKLFRFDKENALKEWKEKIFKNKVLYSVEPIQEGGYLAAASTKSCSGLFYRLRFNPKELPMISWKWKVTQFPDKSKAENAEGGWVEKDDYPARVYVIFPSMFFKNTKCIEYVWDENLSKGTTMTSPYMENIKIIVVESGKTNINTWVYEERNIHTDYIDVFGKKPPHVGAIALMTDSDNTLSTAEALYTEIKVGYKNE
ncbi:MAG: DUF3047 domain-containing protein [Candidatus Saelkia tenebricola]|nr:DUF3047 domain-containing protein [Candidatus Saelkia tenebricola]